MKFTSSLIKGKFIKRYKRFFVDIEVNNKTVIAHCPNTGSMMGLLVKGNEVWITKHNDSKRKLKFTLEMIKSKKKIIGVNTHRANKIVEHALENGLIDEFKSTKIVKPEMILKAATIIINESIINITFLSTLRAENKDLFKSDHV